jgi:cell wall-associated NlpC family hydrolase
VGLVVLVGGGATLVGCSADGPAPPVTSPAGAAAPEATAGELTVTRATGPDRTEVRRGATLLAVFTDGARTVRLTGPTRTFAEPRYTTAVVRHDVWVRLAPVAWTAGAERAAWFRPWLDKALADRGPDALAVAMEYTEGAARRTDAKGVQYSGDAAFGPESTTDPDGRSENSDFYDYLGVPWTFPDRKEKPDPAHFRSLDCSGFIRMVYGYRLGYPLRGTNAPGPGLPRRAYAMAEVGPGATLIAPTGARSRDYDLLQPGDLLFFNSSRVPGAVVEHSAIYLGVDDSGHHRFVSSRTRANGPTMGDLGGASLLDGSGYWSVRFRAARRI